jgi:threonine dehydratase
MIDSYLSLDAIRACRARLGDRIVTTPIHTWRGPKLAALAGSGVEIVVKLELLQVTGSFKPRGALNVIGSLSPKELVRGVVAASGGNHAVAVAYAARSAGISAKVVMPRTASSARIDLAKIYGAEVELANDITAVYARTEEIVAAEGRAFVHPFEGPLTAQGTATLALEFNEQAGPLDAVIVPIGGGGLCGGMAAAFKQLQPSCRIIGVEPVGADSMARSLAAGHPIRLDKVTTIADSLGAPMALPYSFALCRDFVDDLVLVDDAQMQQAMRLLFEEMKLAVEPACAASSAALCGPLKGRFTGRRVGLLACGTNIDQATFSRHLAA